MVDISIIILSFNTQQILKNCLTSILKSTSGINYELIVIDNASSDKSVSILKKLFPSVKLVENKENLGFAKGNNQGIKKAVGRYLFFLNSDTLVKKDALFMLMKFMDGHPEVGMVGPKLLNSDGTPQSSAGTFPSLPVVFTMLFKEHFGGSDLVRGSFEKGREVDWVMGAAMMVRKSILPKTGVFDEKIFMYYDEVEWCYRIKKAGFLVYFYPEAEITHLWQKSSRTGRKGPVLANYKGLIYFYKKHKNDFELLILKLMLKLKAALALILGFLTNNSYLKETYAEAFKLV